MCWIPFIGDILDRLATRHALEYRYEYNREYRYEYNREYRYECLSSVKTDVDSRKIIQSGRGNQQESRESKSWHILHLSLSIIIIIIII